MKREEKILQHINKNGIGIEIGPSHRPIASKNEGYNVHVIDHMSREQLIKKYKNHGVDLDKIEEVDFVWHGESYRELTGLLSDNGPCYLSKDLKLFLERKHIEHTRGAPYHPMTQDKIERYHRSMKNIVNLQNYFLPGELQSQITSFVEYYNNQRYHESLDNLTPADVYFGRTKEILDKRAQIKKQTMQHRRLHNLNCPQYNFYRPENITLANCPVCPTFFDDIQLFPYLIQNWHRARQYHGRSAEAH